MPTSATIFCQNGTELDDVALASYLEKPAPAFTEPMIVFFYDPNCGACGPAHEFIDSYLKEHPKVVIEQVNLEGAEQMDRFKEYVEMYNREKIYIPVIYIGPIGLEGADDIKNNFEKVYSWYMAAYNGTPSS